MVSSPPPFISSSSRWLCLHDKHFPYSRPLCPPSSQLFWPPIIELAPILARSSNQRISFFLFVKRFLCAVDRHCTQYVNVHNSCPPERVGRLFICTSEIPISVFWSFKLVQYSVRLFFFFSFLFFFCFIPYVTIGMHVVSDHSHRTLLPLLLLPLKLLLLLMMTMVLDYISILVAIFFFCRPGEIN